MANISTGVSDVLATAKAGESVKGINVQDTVKTYWATVFSRFLKHKVARLDDRYLNG